MGSFNGSGVFVRSYSWVQDAGNGIPITASRVDTEDSGFAGGLSNCITKDGQQIISADIPWNNHKITGLADAVNPQDAVNLRSITQSVIGAILNPQTPAEAAAGVMPVNLAYTEGWVQRYGWVDDNATDNGPLVATLTTLAQSGAVIRWNAFNTGIFKTSVPFLFTVPVRMIGAPGIRIKLTANAAYVCKWQCAISHGGFMSDFILDGGGFAADGLYLSQVVSAQFPRLRATNVTNAGLHLAWAQLCIFDTYTCSNNVETMTTVPNVGLLMDNANSFGVPSSANTFINPTIEQLHASSSGIGVNCKWGINNLFLNGTNEGNQIGYIFGNVTVGDNAAQGNKVIGGDIEANTTWDIQVLGNNSFANDFIGIGATSTNSISLTTSTAANRFIGGFCGGIALDATTQHNVIDSVMLFNNAAVIADSGVNNVIRNVWNVSSGVSTTDQPARRPNSVVLSTTGSASVNCALTDYMVVDFTGAGASTLTINNPTNPVDGASLKYVLRVAGAGAVTLAWGTAFKLPAALSGVQANPANGFNRTYTFHYSVFMGNVWVFDAQSATDVPN